VLDSVVEVVVSKVVVVDVVVCVAGVDNDVVSDTSSLNGAEVMVKFGIGAEVVRGSFVSGAVSLVGDSSSFEFSVAGSSCCPLVVVLVSTISGLFAVEVTVIGGGCRFSSLLDVAFGLSFTW
jgi:hypothetical protein